jgi:hypothetical protein
MFEEMARLREEVHPKDHTPKIVSKLRSAVLKHGKDIMQFRDGNVVQTFWMMLENVDEGVAERSALTALKKMSSFPFERLPNVMITSVCQYLDVDTLMSLSQTSHRYRKMLDDPLTWKYAVLTLYKDMPMGYNKMIDERGGRYLLERAQRIHIESAYLANKKDSVSSYYGHYRYSLFVSKFWSNGAPLPIRELVCPWRLIIRSFLDIVGSSAKCPLEILRFTGTGVAYGSHFGHELITIMRVHKNSLRELDAIPSLPLHVYLDQERTQLELRDGVERLDAITKICDALRPLVHLKKVSLPLARTRSLSMLLFGLFEYSNVNYRDLPQLKDEDFDMDRELANEHLTCGWIESANRELVTAARSLPHLEEVVYVLHTNGSIVDTIAETLEMYLVENNTGDCTDSIEQDVLQLICFEQHPEDPHISINSYRNTPSVAERLSDEDFKDIDKEVLELFGADPIGNTRKYTTYLLETTTAKFIIAACSLFERYPCVHLKIQLQGDYWNKLYDEVVLPKIPVEFHSRLSLE